MPGEENVRIEGSGEVLNRITYDRSSDRDPSNGANSETWRTGEHPVSPEEIAPTNIFSTDNPEQAKGASKKDHPPVGYQRENEPELPGIGGGGAHPGGQPPKDEEKKS